MLKQLIHSPKTPNRLDIVAETLPVPCICIVGFSNSGKTGVVVALVKALRQNGLRVGTIKHDVHGFELDHPGKDSWRHKRAGALTSVISSPHQIGMVRDVDYDHQPNELLCLFSGMDIVLIEGFKRANLPKIEVHRQDNKKIPACKDDPLLIAVVSDVPVQWGVPVYSFEEIEDLADQIITEFALNLQKGPHLEKMSS
ncbi:MAG: molybdopterin-guanine dinucleotide biosynthesis protein B [Deltaproteobacteria bacterium]|jgi:molybdopterin-guanine dinucleotide biosynthesis protein B|nr:molybdopterin-guanine dinucleotide biosynthesis protein B [Deltaproteobacteria bacterium]